MRNVALSPQLHMFVFDVGQAYLWADDDGLTLIDTGVAGSAKVIEAAVHGLGYDRRDIRRIVVTHAHDDHIGSVADVAAWNSATVVAHRLEAAVMRGEQRSPAPVITEEERPFYERIVPGVPAAPVPQDVDREVTDGDVIDFGGGAEVVGMPGHTPGSIAIYLPGPRVLFTGDSVASVNGQAMLGVFNVDRAAAIASFRGVVRRDVDVACFGHGDPLLGDAGTTLRDIADGPLE